jgi:hypothetical protein
MLLRTVDLPSPMKKKFEKQTTGKKIWIYLELYRLFLSP